MSFHRLAFYSKNETHFVDEESGEFLAAVASACAKGNPEDSLTGALLFNQDYFVQVMEGDAASISKQLWALTNDQRHSTMTILVAEAVDSRLFDNWSVGFADSSDRSAALYLRFGTSPTLDPTVMSPADVVTLVNEFVRAEHGSLLKRPGRNTKTPSAGSSA
jgi:hypothetical protein